MDIHDITQYCLSKPDAYLDYPFGPSPAVVKVYDKMFALVFIRNDKPCLSLKCDPFVAKSLRQQYSAVAPGYHLNKEHWNTVVIDGSVPDDEIMWMIDHSYELVVRRIRGKRIVF